MITAKVIQSAVDCELCVTERKGFFWSLVRRAVVSGHFASYWQQIADGQDGRPEEAGFHLGTGSRECVHVGVCVMEVLRTG